MNLPTTSNILLKYQEQNSEIIKNNVKLNERIAILEKVIGRLQQENLELKINHIVKKEITKKPYKPRVKKPKAPSVKEDIPTELPPKRISRSKSVDYTAPSLKAKLRKGDPHTFGL